MERNTKVLLNAEYAATFGAYWMIYVVVGSFASVFMLAKGYNNSQIGLTLAAANILALIMQPWIADFADVSGRSGILKMSVSMSLVMMILGAGMYIFKGGSLMLALMFVVILSLQTVIQPLLNTLPFKFSRRGDVISFSVGRAGGSAGFAIMLAVLGRVIDDFGIMIMPAFLEFACISFAVLMILINISFDRLSGGAGKAPDVDWQSLNADSDDDSPGESDMRSEAVDMAENAIESSGSAESAGSAEGAESDDDRISLGDFIKRNKMFFIMNLGIAGLFYSNATLSNYMAQISAEVGGTTEELGRILSVMGFMEIPTMLFFDKIKKRFKVSTLIKAGSLGFTAKILVCHLANSVAVLTAAQMLQLVAFSLFMPSMVHFTNEIMSRGEAVKGQALYVMMITLSTVVSSLAGGRLLDVAGAGFMTFVSLIATAIGAVIVILTVDRLKDEAAAKR